MSVTVYSFLMSIITSSVMILILLLLFRWRWFLLKFGPMPLIILSIASAIRILVPGEISGARVVSATPVYNPLNNLLQTPVPAQSTGITLCHGIIFFWIGVAGILLLRFIHINVKAYGIAFQLPQADIPHLHTVLSDTIRDKDKCKLNVAICSDIDTPQILGFRRSVILLPLRNYQKQELSAIIAHEYQHYIHHDIWLRLILQLIAILFWWNPLVYLLKQNTETALDILCDMVLLRDEPFERVRAYGKTLVKFAPKQNRNTHNLAAQFACSKTVFSRYDYMVHGNKRKRHGTLIAFWCIISITLTILSFSFILQSAYEPEATDYTAIPIENTDLYFNEQGILCTRVNGAEVALNETQQKALQANGLE